MLLQRGEHELAPLREDAATLLRGHAAGAVQRLLQRAHAARVFADALRHAGDGSRGGRELGHREARLAHDLVHELLALVLAALVALEVARLDLKAHTAAGPLLGLADGLAEHLLTAGVAAVGADI